MNRQLFPDDFEVGRDDRVAMMWDLSYPLPTPRYELRCPVCSHVLVLKDWKFHTRQGTGSKAPWRCDVRMKCVGCSYVPSFGVAVPERYYVSGRRMGNSWISWRTGKRALADAGFFDT